ncbi:MAG: hypothetical protein UZ22_OP11002001122 [Microgenomates bacterium OLB23]|nr:MAG: hypothetical protein UZ22_OP11002001122 [Microgenomates bacterium OLB23]
MSFIGKSITTLLTEKNEPQDVAKFFHARIKKHNATLNAYTFIDNDVPDIKKERVKEKLQAIPLSLKEQYKYAKKPNHSFVKAARGLCGAICCHYYQ